ncbi:MAG TPA: wax ester/triacylglycerol synthase family O-acyltransferase [Candidatus Dormibacteraeota bacterium]|nr:wax ester/triacylglycerol synthase family O-acyltransferase [Candidatus Dormibacteraeota bacterium]
MSQRLGALDSVFLNLEETRAPMHVGGLLTFVTESESTSRPGVDGIFDVIESRLPLLPRCRQHLVDVPFGLGRPVWVDDPDFDIRNHLIRVSLPRPGTRAQLIELVESLHAQRLDRDRPLWEIYLIDGLEGGRTGIYAKLHHAMVDGLSAIELGLVLLDLDPDGALAPQVPAAATAGEVPLPGTLLVDAWRDAAQEVAAAGAQVMRAAPSVLRAAVEGLSGDRNRAASVLKTLRAAPNGPLNGTVGHGRRVAFVRLPLPEIKAVKNRLGGTVNDVVLATMGEAISHYLARRGIDADGLRYRVLVPVSVRGDGDKTMNNQVSGMLLDLPVGPMNAHRRLWAVTHAMSGLKQAGQTSATEQFLVASALTPAPLQALASRLGMANQRIINMVVSNVPGVQMPVFAAGSRTLEMYPLLPLGPNTRLVVCVLSYNNELNIGLVADRASVPDLHVMEEGITMGFAGLREAAGLGQDTGIPTEAEPVLA